MMDVRERLAVCSIEDAADIVQKHAAGAVITMSYRDIQREADQTGHGDAARLLISEIAAQGLPHHKSRIFYPDAAAPFAPFFAQKPEPRAVMRRNINVTLSTTYRFLGAMPEGKKLVIHCMAGQDRSASLAFLLLQEQIAPVQMALAALHRLQPRSLLGGIMPFYESYFDADFAAVSREVGQYTAFKIELLGLMEEAKAANAVSLAAWLTGNDVQEDLEGLQGRREFLKNVRRYRIDLGAATL